MPRDYCHINHGGDNGIAHNTRRKKRSIEDAPSSSSNQVATLKAIPHATVANALHDVTSPLQNQNNEMTKEPHVVPIHIPDPMVTKVPTKSTYTPLNIVDKLKRTNVSASTWDVLAIPSQLELLQQELKTVKVQNGPTTMDGETSFVKPIREEETSKKINPLPFYLSLIIGDKLVHNCMIDSGASRSIMPKCVADGFGVQYEPMAKRVL